MDNHINEIVECIIKSKEYQECLRIKDKMKENPLLIEKIENIKKLQKEFVNTNDENIKIMLDDLENELDNIPIYRLYMQNLEIVNNKINYVKDELNDYFYKLFND